jgi:hypothetical protein
MRNFYARPLLTPSTGVYRDALQNPLRHDLPSTEPNRAENGTNASLWLCLSGKLVKRFYLSAFTVTYCAIKAIMRLKKLPM